MGSASERHVAGSLQGDEVLGAERMDNQSLQQNKQTLNDMVFEISLNFPAVG
jgi:hypothetical protein